jgi:hypothetical protein
VILSSCYRLRIPLALVLCSHVALAESPVTPSADPQALAAMKKQAVSNVESHAKLAQVMVDTVFS